MRRFVLPMMLCIIAVTVIVARNDGTDGYRVDAVFDSARSIVPGQVVKIAGAKVGTVEGVHLTSARKARLELEIDQRFAPFHDDATCRILPEGFISENFVQCDPGTPGRTPLEPAGGGRTPTVALARTAVPVQLQQVIDTFSLPVSQRIQVLLSELGIASAGRGEDLNALLRRANPALASTNRLLAVLKAQRAEIGRAVVETDGVLARLKTRDRDIERFVSNAATVASTSAEHREGLRESLRKLPPLLAQVRPAMDSLDGAATALTPTVRSLRRAAPGLEQLNRSMLRFANSGGPAVRAVGSASAAGSRAIPTSRPVARQLDRFARRAADPSRLARELLVNLRDVGGVENLLNFVYTLATLTSSFDAVSHIIGFNISVQEQCFVDPNARGCVHKYDSPGQGRIPVNDPDNPAVRRAAGKPRDLKLPRDTARDLRRTIERILK